MVLIEPYIESLIKLLKQNFVSRLLYVGLQGSYLRGEANENSDIDIMVVLDGFSVEDLILYRNTINEVGNNAKSCGFICGKSELANWNPLEICQLVHTTKDYYGQLSKLIPLYTAEDNRNFIKLSLNNLFHEICHRYIHASREKNAEKLPSTYKNIFFILQNLYFQKTGNFIQTKKELLSQLSEEDSRIFSKALELGTQSDYGFDEAFQVIFEWCKNTIQNI